MKSTELFPPFSSRQKGIILIFKLVRDTMTTDMSEKFLVKANKIRIERKNPLTTASFSVTVT